MDSLAAESVQDCTYRLFEAVHLANAIDYIVSSLRLRRSQKLVRYQPGEPCRELTYS
jgi:hypothetical protein